jgi:hypothetical protein
MTTSRKFSEDEGEFTSTAHHAAQCRQCGSDNVTCKTWESSDGGYEDYKYICQDCGHIWWVDGIDA